MTHDIHVSLSPSLSPALIFEVSVSALALLKQLSKGIGFLCPVSDSTGTAFLTMGMFFFFFVTGTTARVRWPTRAG